MSLLSMGFSDLHLHIVVCFYHLIMALVHHIIKLSYHVGGCCSFIPANPQEIRGPGKNYTFTDLHMELQSFPVALILMLLSTPYSIVIINVVYADSVYWTKGNF